MGAISDFFADAEIGTFFDTLTYNGWYQYIFPFLLVYVLVFTALGQVDLFKNKKPVRVIISVIFALFAIAFPISDSCPSYIGPSIAGGGCSLGDLMSGLFPGVSAFTLGILALYIIAGLLGVDLMDLLGKTKKEKQIMKYVLGVAGILFVVYYFGVGFGWWQDLDSLWWLGEILKDPMLYILVVFGIVFYWINKEDSDEKPEDNKKKRVITEEEVK